MKRILLFCLALMLTFSSVPFALSEDTSASEPEAQPPVYRDENITVTAEYMTVEGNTVKAGFRVSCPENRSCIILPNVKDELLTDEDGFVTLRKMREIGAGQVIYNCAPEQDTLCEYIWDLDEVYDYSVLSLFPSDDPIVELTPVSVPLKVDSFPKVAGFTIVESLGDLTVGIDMFLKEGIQQEVLKDYLQGAISLQFSAEE